MMILWNYSSSTAPDTCVSDQGVPRNISPHDFILVGPASAIGRMKDSSWPGGTVCPETYHGTRMNQRALSFHTQLHDWSDAQRLSSLVKSHPRIMPVKSNTEIYLPVKRLAQIENWTRDVNKYYLPDRGPRVRSGSFMVIDVSKFNLKSAKTDQSRIKSAIYPSHSKPRIVSAVSSATTGAKRRFFGTDCHTVNTKLVDTQMHYSAQRRNIYSASTKKSLTTDKTLDMTKEDTSFDLPQESETDTPSTLYTSTKASEPSEDAPVHLDREILQPHITARSWSNKMLNVISIDDCKLTCRYRPQTIKETRELPKFSGKLGTDATKGTTKGKNAETDKIDGCATGEDADDEEESDEDIVDIAETRRNGIHISNGIDTNNNESVDQNARHKPNGETDICNGDEIVTENESSENINGEKINSNSTGTSPGEGAKVNFKSEKESTRTPSDRTSYGRLTNLYSNSIVTTNTKDRKKKKQTQSYKLNHAINDMVEGRRVMNSMERDFDTRTAQFGRTVVEKSEGSQTFQKLHANLRKKIDGFLDTHSAIKTQQFYEQRRKNSDSTPSSPRKNGVVNNK